MSFRKRSVPLSNLERSARDVDAPAPKVRLHGVRPSAQFPYLMTTSTGTASLDDLLGLGAGLALGSILVVEEDGSTDYAGLLLSCFASQGVLHEQDIFVGAPQGSWPMKGTLPGLAKETKRKVERSKETGDGMKIAWRYERLGVVGSEHHSMMPAMMTLLMIRSIRNALLPCTGLDNFTIKSQDTPSAADAFS
jgi:elongator complex protein 4